MGHIRQQTDATKDAGGHVHPVPPPSISLEFLLQICRRLLLTFASAHCPTNFCWSWLFAFLAFLPADATFSWPAARIPFEDDPRLTVDPDMAVALNNARMDLQVRSCIRLVPRKGEQDYAYFTDLGPRIECWNMFEPFPPKGRILVNAGPSCLEPMRRPHRPKRVFSECDIEYVNHLYNCPKRRKPSPICPAGRLIMSKPSDLQARASSSSTTPANFPEGSSSTGAESIDGFGLEVPKSQEEDGGVLQPLDRPAGPSEEESMQGMRGLGPSTTTAFPAIGPEEETGQTETAPPEEEGEAEASTSSSTLGGEEEESVTDELLLAGTSTTFPEELPMATDEITVGSTTPREELLETSTATSTTTPEPEETTTTTTTGQQSSSTTTVRTTTTTTTPTTTTTTMVEPTTVELTTAEEELPTTPLMSTVSTQKEEGGDEQSTSPPWTSPSEGPAALPSTDTLPLQTSTGAVPITNTAATVAGDGANVEWSSSPAMPDGPVGTVRGDREKHPYPLMMTLITTTTTTTIAPPPPDWVRSVEESFRTGERLSNSGEAGPSGDGWRPLGTAIPEKGGASTPPPPPPDELAPPPAPTVVPPEPMPIQPERGGGSNSRSSSSQEGQGGRGGRPTTTDERRGPDGGPKPVSVLGIIELPPGAAISIREKTKVTKVVEKTKYIGPCGSACTYAGQLVRLYRSFNSNPQVMDHFYTTERLEQHLMASQGFLMEPSMGFLGRNQIDPNCSCIRPLYRLYSAFGKDHFLTTDDQERGVAETLLGYSFERILGYCTKEPGCGAYLPLYRFFNAISKDHFYTVDQQEMHYYKTHTELAYGFEKIECYVWQRGASAKGCPALTLDIDERRREDHQQQQDESSPF